MTDDINALKRMRATVKASCTRIKNYVDTITEVTTAVSAALEVRQVKLDQYWTEYNKIQTQIESLVEDQDRESFECAFYDLAAKIKVLAGGADNGGHRNVANATPTANVAMKSGNAAEVISSIELSNQNYDIAWDLLKERYNNVKVLVQAHIQAIFELPTMVKENANDLRQIADGTARQWRTSLKEREIPTLKQFMAFLHHRCEVLEAPVKPVGGTSTQGRINIKRQGTHAATVKSQCNYCKEDHLIYYCADFLKLTIPERISKAQPSQVEAITNSVTTCTSTSCSRITLLSTAVVDVLDRYGCGQRCRTLLDNGSQANLISSSFVKRLQLPTQTTDIVVSGINGTISKSSHIVQLTFQSRATNYRTNIKCIVTDKITERLPSRSIDKSKLQVPSHIRLADPNFHVSDDVDLLLGVEVFWELVCPNQIKISPGHPILQQTKSGGSWQVDSPLTVKTPIQFWRIEEPPHLSDPFTIEEMECEHHFTQNVTRNPEGRIVVKLPIKDNKVNSISDTRAIALRRFYKIERKLDFRPILKRDYAPFMHEYVQLGHMTPIETEEPANTELPVFYLPHHCVIKPDSSSSTKLRVVFDGSCKGPTGISLNNALRVGPVIQQDLISILLRFRTLPFVITADIIKMYRQVLIASQTQLQRIFWRDNSSDPLQIFELKTVTYGTSSASYLATRALKYLADLYKNDYPLASQCMLRDFYVDDVLTGGTSIDECIRLRDELIQLLGKGGIPPRKVGLQ
ncbi:uncharacterized protein LOC118648846 [Monomorium pharaonis]|uniref:uncharacterized protein LOC118648846 n=1 Tax=Monomorium pharaonis TaxID=307658 RepID=UPI00174657C7|nr:uncharacterized protein LOC118648846 [Monomorium pharaonis]